MYIHCSMGNTQEHVLILAESQKSTIAPNPITLSLKKVLILIQLIIIVD